MDDGRRIPPLHDGMAAFAGENGRVVLVRNHEIGVGVAFDAPTYDSQAGGGTTTTVFDPATEKVVSTRVSLSGTIAQLRRRADAVGLVADVRGKRRRSDGAAGTRFHSSTGTSSKSRTIATSDAKPIKAHGLLRARGGRHRSANRHRLSDTGSDAGRPLPLHSEDRDKLAEGGRLQMLAVDGRSGVRYQPRATLRARRTTSTGSTSRNRIGRTSAARSGYGMGVLQQGLDRGGAIFSRLEGAIFGDGRLYVTATDGGDAKMGQVWEIDPRRDRLRLVFESPGAPVLNMPDNLTLSPRGGLVLCEDGTMTPCVHGLTTRRAHLPLRAQQHQDQRATQWVDGRLQSARVRGRDLQP